MKKIFLLIVVLLTGLSSIANNVQITNVSIVNNGVGNIQVKFDVSWDNSWRVNVGPNNYDGVWVFFKYKTATGNWTHLTMTGSNNVVPVGVDVHQPNDFQKAGAIIYREVTNMGIGSISVSNIRLGVLNTLPYDVEIRAFAVEMVYIPAPPTRQFIGDGDGTTESTNAFHYSDNIATNQNVVKTLVDINSFDDAELDTDGIYFYFNDTIQLTNPLGTLDPFPTMKALWCMKYEITLGAYRDFLNTLTYDQQANRTIFLPNNATGTGALVSGGSNRNYIEIKTPGVANTTAAVYGCDGDGDNIYDEATDGEWVACGYLTWPDVAAFLDWSGLAPMSEIQFERICRGTSSAGSNAAVLGQYAWGTNTITNFVYTLAGINTANESVSNASPTLGNATYGFTASGGPVRSGIFATGVSNRITSGASFYGVMDMSGNVEEYVITVGNVAGRSVLFIPNGNGALSVNGHAQLSSGGAGYWPGMEGNNVGSTDNTCAGLCEVTGNAGIVNKGGSFAHIASELTISGRTYSTPTGRLNYRGGRGVLYIK